jgi:type IV secretory pathway component VirB8
MKRYVIHKSTREPRDVSYVGSTWDQAGMRAYRKDTYASKFVAEQHARQLSKFNPVGFSVAEIEVKEETK